MNTAYPKKLVIALSGGIDSSVAAALLIDAGVEVIAVTYQIQTCNTKEIKQKSCCETDTFAAAGRIAKQLNIPHYSLNFIDDFKEKVLKQSWQEYSHARTPNPCVLCNSKIKFGKLLDFAFNIGADGIATGHHCKIIHSSSGAILKKGNDPLKDQSYFLSFLSQKQLQSSYMPIGYIDKKKVREIAYRLKFPNVSRPESQDICFGNDNETFGETLRKLWNGKTMTGDFIDTDGKILGHHCGLHNYTIGQRKGLGISLSARAYVKEINPKTREIVITTNPEDLKCDCFKIKEINWLCKKYADKNSFIADVQTRYRQKSVPAKITVTSKDANTAEIHLKHPQSAITPGQAAVFYDKDIVIGGGWIE
ncbi:MAG: tRNA 2-thiouridine(34) synthase MnmA [Verrucomicrobiota bacterium]|nr:tRNA 2-thiouridine(34) synthase MnmA [Verrucomicrobiota bacterium]